MQRGYACLAAITRHYHAIRGHGLVHNRWWIPRREGREKNSARVPCVERSLSLCLFGESAAPKLDREGSRLKKSDWLYLRQCQSPCRLPFVKELSVVGPCGQNSRNSNSNSMTRLVLFLFYSAGSQETTERNISRVRSVGLKVEKNSIRLGVRKGRRTAGRLRCRE